MKKVFVVERSGTPTNTANSTFFTEQRLCEAPDVWREITPWKRFETERLVAYLSVDELEKLLSDPDCVEKLQKFVADMKEATKPPTPLQCEQCHMPVSQHKMSCSVGGTKGLRFNVKDVK